MPNGDKCHRQSTSTCKKSSRRWKRLWVAFACSHKKEKKCESTERAFSFLCRRHVYHHRGTLLCFDICQTATSAIGKALQLVKKAAEGGRDYGLPSHAVIKKKKCENNERAFSFLCRRHVYHHRGTLLCFDICQTATSAIGKALQLVTKAAEGGREYGLPSHAVIKKRKSVRIMRGLYFCSVGGMCG